MINKAATATHPPAVDLVEMTVAQAQAAFASDTTSELLTQAFLGRIAEFNPAYNAIIFLDPAALADTRAIDRRRTVGEVLP